MPKPRGVAPLTSSALVGPDPTTLEGLDAQIVACRRCPRLVEWREDVARTKRASYADEEYWGRPVPGFGAAEPRIWIVGLAPAAHGANRTGRMFTGDRSGDWLFAALHRAGLATQPTSVHRDDGQALSDVRITAAVHCAPPDNKPITQERHTCAQWLDAELAIVGPGLRAIVALGGVAWTATVAGLKRGGWTMPSTPFGHCRSAEAMSATGQVVTVIGSYHPSQQNTFTGRLTESMLDDVFTAARRAAQL